MKAFKVFIALTLIASMLALPSLAAEFTPSAERKDGPELIEYKLEEIDTPCRTVLVIPYGHIHLDDIIDEEHLDLEYAASEAIEETIRESLKSALEELKDNLIHHLVRGFDEAWAKITGGAPVENAVVSDLFEIVLVCSEADALKTDEKITVSFTVDGIGPDDKFIIVHKPTDSDEWIVEDYKIDENGVITMTVDKLSPFAIVKDSGKAPTTDVQSPQTGVSDTGLIVTAVSAVILAAGAVVIGKKLRKTTVQ